MSGQNDGKVQELLRSTIMPAAAIELKRDLWPQMLRRLDKRGIQVPWFDWALIVLLGALSLFLPEGILVLLYYL